MKDNTGNLYTVHYKYSEAETQKKESKHRQKLEQEAAEARRIAEERERIEKQEFEKREKQEKIALWSSGIDIMVQHLKTLETVKSYGQHDPILFEKVAKVFDPMKKYYTAEEQAKLCVAEYPTLDYRSLNENFPSDYAELLGHISDLMQSASERVGERSRLHDEWSRSSGYCTSDDRIRKQHDLFCKEQSQANCLVYDVRHCIKGLLKKKMENYVLYQGTFHPRWEELVTLFGQP